MPHTWVNGSTSDGTIARLPRMTHARILGHAGGSNVTQETARERAVTPSLVLATLTVRFLPWRLLLMVRFLVAIPESKRACLSSG